MSNAATIDSILDYIKTMILGSADDSSFDSELVIHVNGVFSTLQQLRIGPFEGFSITGNAETWTDYGVDEPLLSMIKSYMYLKVRIVFDPPQSATVFKAFEDQIDEYEFRMNNDGEIFKVRAPNI